MSDYIPRGDAEFSVWEKDFIAYVTPRAVVWNYSADVYAELISLQSAWQVAFEVADSKTNRTSAEIQAKITARDNYEAALRSFVQGWIAKNTLVTDSDRRLLGVTVPKKTRTPVAIPETAPQGAVDFSEHLQHAISFVDEETPQSKAKPEGVLGCQIWRMFQDETEFRFVATPTKSPYVINYSREDLQKMVTYQVRWVNTKSEWGPWSAEFSAVIA